MHHGQFRGHVYYQAVRPDIVVNALNWLKANNELYKTIITIDIDRIDRNLTTLEVTCAFKYLTIRTCYRKLREILADK